MTTSPTPFARSVLDAAASLDAAETRIRAAILDAVRAGDPSHNPFNGKEATS